MAIFRIQFKIKTRNGIKMYRTVVEAKSSSWAIHVAHQEVVREYVIVPNTTRVSIFKRKSRV